MIQSIFTLFLSILVCIPSKANQQHHAKDESNMHSNEVDPHWYHLPLLPSNPLPESPLDLFMYNASNSLNQVRKLIPHQIWIAVKDQEDSLPQHMHELFQHNSGWKVNVCDNKCKDEFMNTTFANTSISHMYFLTNPIVYASKADIWRYAALYTYGGFYIDDDSYIATSLNEIVQDKDNMILTEEGASSLGECYISSYHLNEANTFERFKHNYSNAYSYFDSIDQTTGYPKFFHGNTIVNWGMFVKPRHPLLLQTLRNIVEVYTSEFRRHTVLHIAKWDVRWKYVMCSTGFILTYTLKEMLLMNSSLLYDSSGSIASNIPRICTKDFSQYGGKAKQIWTGGDPNHYMKVMNKHKNLHFLKHYEQLNMESILDFLNEVAVMGDGREIYFIRNRQKRLFPDYDTFLAMNISIRHVRHLKDHIIQNIPNGPDMSMKDIFSPVTAQLIPTSSEPNNSGINNSSLYSFLFEAQRQINNMSFSCYRDDYDGTRDEFINGKWQSVITSDHTVMVYPMCLKTFQLGNTLGYYFNDLACSDIVGSHYLAVHKDFDILDPNGLAIYNPIHQKAFFNALPDLIQHPFPINPSVAINKMKQECSCLRYCWENKAAPWLKRIPYISSILRTAIDAYVNAVAISLQIPKELLTTKLNNETDSLFLPYPLGMVSLSDPKYSLIVNTLKLIPNVTMQFRCGDNIGFGKTRYGLLPFRAYTKRIPLYTKTIYIIADSPTRSKDHTYSSRCSIILERLGWYIHNRFPSAVIVIKRGGDLFLDYARLAYSNVTICSASTFCLWPALANKNDVYFPYTPLVAESWDNETSYNLSSHFHWIDIDMIKIFKFRPWTVLLDVLEEEG